MNISGIEIEVIKKNIKNMHLSVRPPYGEVRISVPISIGDDAIRLFAVSKIAWIKKQMEVYKNQPRQSEREYVSGESHYFWGRRYRMEVRTANGNSKINVHGNKLEFIVRPETTVSQRASSLNAWYRKQLRAKLPPLFEKWEAIIGVRSNDIKIKDMRTRWGTCNPAEKRIWINLQLVKKPPLCLEYVVVHELVHLLEKSHNKRFVALMDEFYQIGVLVKRN